MRVKHLFYFISLSAMLLLGQYASAALKPTTAIVVDKKTNMLRVTEYRDGKLTTLKEFHTTLGQVKGDKETEGDLKTPEGIYILHAKVLPPQLAPKFGIMAFHADFPNAFDRIAGRTGSHIMLHATNEPGRLKQNYDSQGCVVVQNEELAEIEKSIRVGLTPMMIFEELKPEYTEGNGVEALKTFFRSWVKAWESKDLTAYIDSYHTDFVAQAKPKNAWKNYKASLNARYKTIQVNPEDVRIYRHPKYAMITFSQNYRSTLKKGGNGHRSRGTKILFVAEEEGQPKIIAETYTTLMW